MDRRHRVVDDADTHPRAIIDHRPARMRPRPATQLRHRRQPLDAPLEPAREVELTVVSAELRDRHALPLERPDATAHLRHVVVRADDASQHPDEHRHRKPGKSGYAQHAHAQFSAPSRRQRVQDEHRERRDQRQQVLRLLAAESRERDHHGDHPRDQEPSACDRRSAAGCHQRPAPDGRQQRPGQQQQRQRSQIEPRGTQMMGGGGDATPGLLPKQLARERSTARLRGRQGPERERHETDDDGERQPRIPTTRRDRRTPPRCEHRDRQHMEQHHRTFRKETRADGGGEDHPGHHRRATLHVDRRIHQRIDGQQHKTGEQQVEHHRAREGHPSERAAGHDGDERRPRSIRCRVLHRSDSAGKAHREPERAQCEQAREQPRPPRPRSGELPTREDQPEKQRRFMTVQFTVEMQR